MLKTLGDHLLKRRFDLGLTQPQVAVILNSDQESVCHWEKNRNEPATRFIPRIIKFIGYDPLPMPTDLRSKLRHCRVRLGLSQEQLAKQLGLDESTINEWETGKHRPSARGRQILARFFARLNDPVPHPDQFL